MTRVLAAVAAGLVAVVVAPTATFARTEQPLRLVPLPRATAATVYARLSEPQRIGQLFIAGVPSTGASQTRLAALRRRHIGNALLDNDTNAGRHAVSQVTGPLAATLTARGVSPYIGTDQEGGEVQRLTGAGFPAVPTALEQGAMSSKALRLASRSWGSDLARAGVNLDLAPVADVVPAKHAHANQPIGRYDREFGHTPAVVAPHVVAFIRGQTAAGVATTVKHFPGLGRASGNTDTARHVTDPTTRHDRYLKPFRVGVQARVPFVMVSSATYPNIDPGQLACFSPTIIRSMLRGDLHFTGVVLSDDLSVTTLRAVPVAKRAVRFFSAGGTMLLDTRVGELAPMTSAVLARVRAHPAFARTIKAAVMTDLTAKAKAGLLTTAS